MKLTKNDVHNSIRNLEIALSLIQPAFEHLKNLPEFQEIDGIGNEFHRNQIKESITKILEKARYAKAIHFPDDEKREG